MRSRVALVLAVGIIMVAACSSPTPPPVSTLPSARETPASAAAQSPAPSLSSVQSTAPPSPAAEATVPTDWATYRSPRYAYSVDYPTDWIPTEAQQDWPASGFSFPEDYAIDKWAAPPTSPNWILMFVSSVPLKNGETSAQRIARLDADNATVCDLTNRRDVTLDGAKARREDGMCFGADYISEVAAIKNGRFYLVYVLSAEPFTDTTLATFDHFLESFHFAAA